MSIEIEEDPQEIVFAGTNAIISNDLSGPVDWRYGQELIFPCGIDHINPRTSPCIAGNPSSIIARWAS